MIKCWSNWVYCCEQAWKKNTTSGKCVCVWEWKKNGEKPILHNLLRERSWLTGLCRPYGGWTGDLCGPSAVVQNPSLCGKKTWTNMATEVWHAFNMLSQWAVNVRCKRQRAPDLKQAEKQHKTAQNWKHNAAANIFISQQCAFWIFLRKITWRERRFCPSVYSFLHFILKVPHKTHLQFFIVHPGLQWSNLTPLIIKMFRLSFLNRKRLLCCTFHTFARGQKQGNCGGGLRGWGCRR